MAFPTTSSNSAEQVRFGVLTRSKGKCLIALRGVRDAEQVKCKVTGPNDEELPGRVVSTERGDAVAVLPVFPFDQRVSIIDSQGCGEVLARRAVRPFAASLTSKINAVRKDSVATALRASEALASEDGISVDLLAREGSTEVLRGKVLLSFRDGDERLCRPIEIIVLDKNTGSPLSDNWVCLGDSSQIRENYPGIIERIVDYSVRIPASTTECVVWARWKDSSDTVGFSVLYSEWMASLRGDWSTRVRFADRDPAYEDWYFNFHRATESELSIQEATWDQLGSNPSFSIIVPLFKTPLPFLQEMVSSVLSQTYPLFELILVNASPEDEKLAEAVEEIRCGDERVKLVKLDGNFGITENTNAGIRHATGEYLVFLDHDDIIEPDALYCYAKAISKWPDTDMLYCDEDHLKDGHLVMPFFKSEWDKELICAENYVCHMLSVRREIVESLEKLPGKEFDGSQDHNLTLVVGDRARRVTHVPRLLYHWRIHEQSVAGAGIDQKPYALEAERIAVQNHVDRAGVHAEVVMGGRIPTRCDLVYSFDDYPLVSIIIPSHDGSRVLRRCLDSLLGRLTWKNYEVVIVENGSVEKETFAYYEEICAASNNVKIVECELDSGFNFSRLINAGVRSARGEYLLLLNNDTEVISTDLIELMMGPALRDKVGCVGAKLLYPDGLVQHAGVSVGRSFGPSHIGFLLPDGEAGYYERMVLPHQVSAVTAACLLTKKSVFYEVGGLDEGLPVDYNDVDFCLKVRAAGYDIVEQVNAKMYHYESVSRGMEKTPEQMVSLIRALGLYGERWGDQLMLGDPYYSKNFGFNDVYCKLDNGDLPAGATSLADFV